MSLTEHNLSRRPNWLTASDIPRIMAIAPPSYGGPCDVYLEKTEPGLKRDATDDMTFGDLMEPVLIQFAKQKLGIGATKANVWRTSNEETFMGATLDAVIVGKPQHIEAKVAQHHTDAWGEAGSDEVPMHVIAQTQAQMFVARTETVWVPALVGLRGVVIYRVDRSDELIQDVILPAARKFWACVKQRTMPDGDPPSLELLKKLRREPGLVATHVSEELVAWAAEREKRMAFEKSEKAALELLLSRMESAEAATCYAGTMTYLPQSRTDIDTKRLKAECPVVAEEYSRTTEYRVARWKPVKNGDSE